MQINRVRNSIKAIVGIAIGLVIAFPLFYSLSFSFMPHSEIVSYPPKLWPSVFTLKNYILVFTTIPIFKFIFNSLFICVCVIGMQILTSSLAAYGFVFFEFPMKKILFILILATMMIPGEATIISNYLTMSSAKLLDSYLGLMLPFFGSAMGIFMIRQNYLTIPKEMREAASIDGCGDVRFFTHILFPLSIPVVSALVVYIFIGTWNQYMWPLLITNTEQMRTVQIGISMLQFADGLNYGAVCAGCVIILIPTVTMFIIGQQKMIGGITAGSVKG